MSHTHLGGGVPEGVERVVLCDDGHHRLSAVTPARDLLALHTVEQAHVPVE